MADQIASQETERTKALNPGRDIPPETEANAESAEQRLHAYVRKFSGRSLADELIAERRDEAQRESGS